MSALEKHRKEDYKKEIYGLAFLALAALCFVCLWLSNTSNSIMTPRGIGTAGEFLVRVLSGFGGKGSFLLPFYFVFVGTKLILKGQGNTWNNIGALMLLTVILSIYHLISNEDLSHPWDAIVQGAQGEGGGILGASLAVLLYFLFGIWGSYIILAFLLLISLLLVTSTSITEVIRFLGVNICQGYGKLKVEITDFIYSDDEDEEDDFRNNSMQQRRNLRKKHIEDENEDHSLKMEQKNEPVVKIYPDILMETEENKEGKQKDEKLQADKDNIPFLINESNRNAGTGEGYEFPPLSLLRRPIKLKNPRLSKDISENVRLLEETLQSFGVQARVSQVNRGPAITRYEVQPAPGTKVSKILNLSNDIALTLAASSVRIEAPIPGKAAVGIEVPNKEIEVVHFRELLETPEFLNSPSKLAIVLGKDIAGNAIVADLGKMPHLLIAGATGSGKSVCLNVLVSSLLFRARPEELKFLMIDPKMVELTIFEGIPHLVSPVVTNAQKASVALRWMVNEMERRYECFSSSGVKDITRYNALKEKEQPVKSMPALPYIVVIIDELADLMMEAPADVEDAICRLAQMARAAGIHLVIATQRPSVDVITGIIKANIPTRIAFAVSSQTDSRTILDTGGAEKLLGQGDMLFYPVGASKAIRVQGAYASDDEVEAIVNFVKKQGSPEYNEKITEFHNTKDIEEEKEDELLPEAVKIFLENGQASISMLQRRLRIGYTRAARLVDTMEKRGIVGSFEGSKARSLLITWDDYQKLF